MLAGLVQPLLGLLLLLAVTLFRKLNATKPAPSLDLNDCRRVVWNWWDTSLLDVAMKWRPIVTIQEIKIRNAQRNAEKLLRVATLVLTSKFRKSLCDLFFIASFPMPHALIFALFTPVVPLAQEIILVE
jgi:hypothetical protein